MNGECRGGSPARYESCTMSRFARHDWKITQLPPAPIRRFTVDEYHRMIQAGVLTEDDPVELLDGWIVLKFPSAPPHDVTIDLVADALRSRIPDGWRVRIRSPITTLDSELEPDLTVVRGPVRRYLGEHPTPQDVALVVEVSGSSLQYDREVKGPAYARAGITAYWIANLIDARIDVYSDPTNGANAGHKQYAVPVTVPLVIAS